MKKTQQRKRGLSPAFWGIGAAVLLFAVLAVVLVVRSHRTEEERFTLPPMVYAENVRWLFERDISAEAAEWEADFQYLGEITSVIGETEYVSENFQANFPAMGAAVYRYGEYLVLRHGETVWLMRPMADVQTETFPA